MTTFAYSSNFYLFYGLTIDRLSFFQFDIFGPRSQPGWLRAGRASIHTGITEYQYKQDKYGKGALFKNALLKHNWGGIHGHYDAQVIWPREVRPSTTEHPVHEFQRCML